MAGDRQASALPETVTVLGVVCERRLFSADRGRWRGWSADKSVVAAYENMHDPGVRWSVEQSTEIDAGAGSVTLRIDGWGPTLDAAEAAVIEARMRLVALLTGGTGT